MTNKDIRWIFFSLLMFLGLDMIFTGFNKINIYIVNVDFQFFLAVGISIVLIFLLYVLMKKGYLGVEEK